MDTNTIATAASILIAGTGVSYTLSARPKVRVTCDRVYRIDAGHQVEHGLVVNIINTGRAPAVIRSAGREQPRGGHEYLKDALPGLEDRGPSAALPAVLAPGEMIQVWLTTDHGSWGKIGASHLRYPWAAMRLLQHKRVAPGTQWLREKKIRAAVPERRETRAQDE